MEILEFLYNSSKLSKFVNFVILACLPALPCLELPCLAFQNQKLRKSLWWLARLTSSHQPSSSVPLGRLQVGPGGVELLPRRSLEVRGSPELQNGGLRALEDAWDDFLLEAFSCQVCS